jgi:hypothetical protein
MVTHQKWKSCFLLHETKRAIIVLPNNCQQESQGLTLRLLKMMHLSGLYSLMSNAPSNIGLYGTMRLGSTPQFALITTFGFNKQTNQQTINT